MELKKIDFSVVEEFEKKIAEFFGAPYCIVLDSCTHSIEIALRYNKITKIISPKRTYLSIPFLAFKLNIDLEWKDESWQDYYYLTENIIDAAVLWKKNSYIANTFMAISFQYQKHLSLGRCGCLLLDDAKAYEELKKISYDGRLSNIPWREQNIKIWGCHYYVTPEICKTGLDKLQDAIKTKPRQWVVSDWPDLTQLDVFKNK